MKKRSQMKKQKQKINNIGDVSEGFFLSFQKKESISIIEKLASIRGFDNSNDYIKSLINADLKKIKDPDPPISEIITQVTNFFIKKLEK